MLSVTLKNLIKPGQALNMMKKSIQKSFSQHLFATNVTISFSLSAAGDIIQQFYQMRIREQKSWDKIRTRNMTCTGIAVGILCHHWYQVLDQHLPGRSSKIVCVKLVLDQVIFSPVCIFIFIFTLNICKGLNQLVNKTNDIDKLEIMNKRFIQFKDDISVKGLKLYLADWVVWPPAQAINFYYLPTKYRVLYDNTISLLYDVYTSHVMYPKGNRRVSDINIHSIDNNQCRNSNDGNQSIDSNCQCRNRSDINTQSIDNNQGRNSIDGNNQIIDRYCQCGNGSDINTQSIDGNQCRNSSDISNQSIDSNSNCLCINGSDISNQSIDSNSQCRNGSVINTQSIDGNQCRNSIDGNNQSIDSNSNCQCINGSDINTQSIDSNSQCRNGSDISNQSIDSYCQCRNSSDVNNQSINSNCKCTNGSDISNQSIDSNIQCSNGSVISNQNIDSNQCRSSSDVNNQSIDSNSQCRNGREMYTLSIQSNSLYKKGRDVNSQSNDGNSQCKDNRDLDES